MSLKLKSYRLLEVMEHLHRSVALNFPNSLWIYCEIGQLNISKGHYFLEILEKEGNSILAQTKAVLWARTYRRIQIKRGVEIKNVLQEGMEVLLKVQLKMDARYGFKMDIEDVDLNYTFGTLAIQRKQKISKLSNLNILTKNAQIHLPLVLQRIAIISSENAAGFKDYISQLQENNFGYVVESTLFPSTVQGQYAANEMRKQLAIVIKSASKFDAVVFIRGGGAKLDLSAFDDFDLCKDIANCPIPIITGIGHEVDECIADMVSHTVLKTPTAVADFILQSFMFFDSRLNEILHRLRQKTQKKALEEQKQLLNIELQLKNKLSQQLRQEEYQLDFINKELSTLGQQKIQVAGHSLELAQKRLVLLDPKTLFKRGFSMALYKGKPIVSQNDLEEGDYIHTVLKDGDIKSVVVGK